MSTKVSALTQATNAELAGASLAYVVIDPSGTPASRKSTLARIGALPVSFLDEWSDYYGFALNQAGDYTTGQAFVPRRTSQTCTGIRVYWNSATATTLKLALYPTGGGAALASVNVSSSSAGFKTGTFASAVNLTKSSSYVAAVYSSAGGQAPELAPGGKPTAAALALGDKFRDFAILGWGYYQTGDASPSQVYTNNFYAVEPIISG